MCGIVAVAGESLPRAETLATMRDRLAHRGPDEATSEVVDEWVALGFRRLAIIDVAGARQPLRSEDGKVVCIFNGELYNFVALRERLRALGHRFETAGDGEVIVHGYEQWGDEVFAMLEGMFAIALVDRARRRFVLARDRFGIKPIFYMRHGRGVAAASEIKALLPICDRRVASRQALELGALRMHVPWPHTAFAGIYRLPPGSLLSLTRGSEPRLSRFAPMAIAPREAGDAGETLTELRTAVARQMVADVPVGAFLSGGIDSTLIVAMMREVSSAPIHTFSIRTPDQDESNEAAITARALDTTHHTIDLADTTFDALSELPSLYDEPFAETSALGVRALSRAAREHVKVALSGDGGDEVFGGYGFYRWIRALGALPVHEAVGARAHALLMRRAWSPSMRRLLRAALLAGDSPEAAARDVTTLAWAAPADARRASETLSARILGASQIEVSALGAARRAMLSDRLERLPNAMLTKVDIASMSAGLEVRVPMLDDALVAHAQRIPISQLVGWRWGKLVLRQALERTPAGRLAWAKKRGFTLPLERWMTSTTTAPRFEALFQERASLLRELTGQDVPRLWTAFRRGDSRFSQGTAAMQLQWFANVALWAEHVGVTTAVDEPVPDNSIV